MSAAALYSREDCIEDIKRISKKSEDGFVSRKRYRKEGAIPESVWEKEFGTFEEFKRQSELALTRGANRVRLAHATHMSLDNYRELGAERAQYAENYIRPTDKPFKTILVGTDFHDIEVDRFTLRVFLDTAKRVQPDVICLNGDIFDLAEFGRFTVDPRDWDVVGRIKFVHENIFGPLREACPDAQIDLIEGNHEARLLRHLADATPALKSVLSDLHGFTVPKLLGLDRFQINYIAKGDLSAWSQRDSKAELRKNYKVYYRCFLANHFPDARQRGMPGWNGHHHSHICWTMHNEIYNSYEWHQLGAGHKREADYANGEKWSNGFALAHCNASTLSNIIEYVPVEDFSIVGGKFYERLESERFGKRSIFSE